ncbi:hypothetical protein FRC12_024564 [Ceratobasidium sp. 428]|nr:hypothetical protein FRC12_024564 [Ceratobasidium sp. 428]
MLVVANSVPLSRMTNYLNSQTLPPPRPPIKDTDPLFENTPAEEYDLNSIIPIPKKPLETSLVRVEPLIPSVHGERLAEEFMQDREGDPDVFFYPFPYGKPYSELFYGELYYTHTEIILSYKARDICLSRETTSPAQLLAFCHHRQKIGRVCGYLCSRVFPRPGYT